MHGLPNLKTFPFVADVSETKPVYFVAAHIRMIGNRVLQ